MTPQAKARERLRILAASLRGAAKHPSEAESIHRVRVSIRRFTQVLRVFDGLFPHSRKMRRRLRGVMDLFGEVRNCDIASEVLAAAGVQPDPALEKRLKRRRAGAQSGLAKLLTERDTRAGMRRWRGWLTAKGDRQGTAQVLPRLAREFSAAGRAAAKTGAGFDQMHKFRLLVKRYRYTAEILGGKTGGPPVDVLRGLQEHLGAINDCVTTADLIDDLERSAAEKRRIKTAVNRLLARRAAEFRAYWRSRFNTPPGTKSRRKK
jgi:CHAD domain-containing protein